MVLKFDLFHNPGYTGRRDETRLVACGSSPLGAREPCCVLFGRSLPHLGRHFQHLPREAVCIQDDSISRQTLAVLWSPQTGLELYRLSDERGTRVYYREWGKTPLPLSECASHLSDQTVVRLGEHGYWLRLEVPDQQRHPSRRPALTSDSSPTVFPSHHAQSPEFVGQFTCLKSKWNVRHLLEDTCDKAHNRARRNLVWLVGAALPLIAWPVEGWVLPQECESYTVRARVSQFDATNRNPTVAKNHVLEAITAMSLEGHISTIHQALQRIIEEDWLPKGYIREVARRLNKALPVNWAVSRADRIACVAPFRGKVTLATLAAHQTLASDTIQVRAAR